MQQRSETLDSDIEAKEERVGKLDNQLEELENELNNLSSKEPWQQNIFHSLTYLLYKTNPTMQSCIKAIQDFAFSGTGCRGGKHGDIFWDEESSTIKSFMEYYNISFMSANTSSGLLTKSATSTSWRNGALPVRSTMSPRADMTGASRGHRVEVGEGRGRYMDEEQVQKVILQVNIFP